MNQNEVRIGVAGAGPWGRNLTRAFRGSSRCRVVAICDTHPSRLEGLGEVETSVSAAWSIESFVSRADIDAVVIATPAETHAAFALQALNAGRDVFVEKPMALSSRDATELCERARALSRKLMVGHVLLYHPAVESLLDRIADGELGRIERVESHRYSTSQRPRPEGAWWSLAPHDVSLMRRLFGTDPTSISARAGVSSSSNGEDRVDAMLAFGEGRTGSIRVGLHAATDVRRILVTGTRRSALFDDRAPDSKLAFCETPGGPAHARAPLEYPRRAEVIPFPGDEPLLLEARRFVEMILDDRPIPSDASEGRSVTSVLEVGAASLAASGAHLRLDGRAGADSVNPEGVLHRLHPLPFLAPL